MKSDSELKTKAIYFSLCKFNALFSKHQRENESTLEKWAIFLASRNTTVDQVSFALAELIRQAPTFMPNAYEIANVLTPVKEPKEYRCEVIINEILNAILDTAASRKINFTDDLSTDVIETIEALGGYRILKEMNFADSYTRSRAVKTALSVLEKIEAKKRNEKLREQGIQLNDVKELSVKQVSQLKAPQTEIKNEQRTSQTLSQVNNHLAEIRESIK